MSTAVVRRAPYAVRSNHKRCGKCGKMVSRSAFQCRRCGKRQRMRPRSLLLILSGCLLVGMFAAAAMGGSAAPLASSDARVAGAANDPMAGRTPAGEPWASALEQAQAPRMTAPELWLAYARDPAAANRRFRDRPLVVSGTVRTTGRDFDGRVVVRFGTDDPFETVNAKLATRDDRSVRSLAKGRPLSLGCVGRGALIGAPLLEDCSVL